ncbi:MAG TPA: endonuclease/exonuclease/phosphatase family protein [Solirubrobacterales bacterium]|nr:endonuclease/exonuclease/phosphatase family protein [Solirubrobacterales bacterium]
MGTQGLTRSFSIGLWGLMLVAIAAPAPAAAQGGFEAPTGTYWFHAPLPRTDDERQSLILKRDSAALPGLCRKGSVSYTEQREAIQVKARFNRCHGWRQSPATIVAEIDSDTGSILTGEVSIPNLGVQNVPATAGMGYGASLRVVTYNVQMLPSTFSATTDPANAGRIARQLEAGGYDVIALNEVFDEEARDAFVNELEESFPYHVDYLSGGTAVNEDSGLMLFSRFPLKSLPDDTYRADDQSCKATNCSRVGFLEFQPCHGDDCLAEKGVGFVRLKNPETGSPVNVAFTHMQASYTPATYPDELEDKQDALFEFSDRAGQIKQIEDLLEETLGSDRLRSEQVIVMGDLNIDGDLANPDLGADNPNRRNLYEWKERMTSAGNPNLSLLPIQDGWAFDNAPAHPSGNFDRGITNLTAWGADADGARLDYVLMNGEETRGCMQHMTIAHNLRYGGTPVETGLGPEGVGSGGESDLSDHFGVNADINRIGNRCRPVDATVLAPPAGKLDAASGTIGHPGEIEWFRINKAGTYSFELNGASGMDYRVYEADDMTTPAPNYKHEITDVTLPGARPIHFVGEQFRVSKAPFFVRVWHRDRAKTGSYTLKVLRHDCSTRELACALAPAERRNMKMPASPPLNGADEKWFELYTEGTASSRGQEVRAVASELDPDAAGYFELELLEAGSPDTSIGIDASQAPDPDPETPGHEQLEVETREADAQKYYAVVRRKPATQPPFPAEAQRFQVRWETDLTILFGSAHGGQSLQIRCLEENDGIDDGDDEVYLEEIRIDGSDVLGGDVFLGDFDAGNPRSLESLVPAPVNFVEGVTFEGFEDDDFAAGEVDDMEATIRPLAPERQGPVDSSIAYNPEGDGLYRIYYNVTHGFDE